MCKNLAPQPRIKPVAPAMEEQDLNPWAAREVPVFVVFKYKEKPFFFSFLMEALLHPTLKMTVLTQFLLEGKPDVQPKDQSATSLGASSELEPLF